MAANSIKYANCNRIRQEDLIAVIKKYGHDILASDNFRSSKKHIQHGTISVRTHSIRVAMCSLLICHKLNIQCCQRELVRGALLHDYFLYDWHDEDHISPHKLHGFFHPGVALRNAMKEYQLTALEKDIIKKHMWPMTVVPPRCREAWIVTFADKYCSLLETIGIIRGEVKR